MLGCTREHPWRLITMVQLIVVTILLLADAVLVAFNSALMRSPLTISALGARATTSQVALAAGAAGAFVLIWVAGGIDRLDLERRLRQGAAKIRAMHEETQRLKAAAYDQERPPLDDIRARLEFIQRDLQIVRARLGGEDNTEGRSQI
jgi:hypothetical protein